MALTSREQKILVFLPAAIVVVGYGLFPFRYQMQQTSQLSREVTAARAAAPSDATSTAEHARLAAVQRELQQETTDLAAVEKRWRLAGGRADGVPARPERIAQLDRLLTGSGLRVIEAGDAEGSRNTRSLPGLEAAARNLAELSENQQPHRRMVRFAGTYKDVLATMKKLAAGDVAAVPLGLTMKSASVDSSVREWTLLVWV